MIEEAGDYNYNKTIICSGAIICARNTRRVILLQKAEGKHLGKWGLVGGTHQHSENTFQGLTREIKEELSFLPELIKVVPLEKFVSNDNLFRFSTYFCVIDKEFIPVLSKEHTAYGWFDLKMLPKPLHKALDLSLKNKIFQSKIQTMIDIIEIL